MMPNSAAFVAAFFGAARLGAVMAPLNVRYRIQELLHYLEDTRAAALIVPGELAATAREALERLAHPPALFQVDEAELVRRLSEGRAAAIPRLPPARARARFSSTRPAPPESPSA